MSEKAFKGRFLKLEKEAPKSQQQRKRKGEKKERGEGKEENRKKKATVALRLSFYNSYSGDRFAPKKLWDAN